MHGGAGDQCDLVFSLIFTYYLIIRAIAFTLRTVWEKATFDRVRINLETNYSQYVEGYLRFDTSDAV